NVYKRLMQLAAARSQRRLTAKDASEGRIDASETPLESVRPRRFNPSTAREGGQANTGGTPWPRVRVAATRTNRSRSGGGTRRKGAAPPSRGLLWHGSSPSPGRIPSPRRANRTTARRFSSPLRGESSRQSAM